MSEIVRWRTGSEGVEISRHVFVRDRGHYLVRGDGVCIRKMSATYQHHDTWEAARDHLLKRLLRQIEDASTTLAKAKAEFVKLSEMTKPE